MKKILLGFVGLLMVFSTVAQNSFSYQAVIRDGGKVLENKTVNLRLSVMLDDKVYYSEQQVATTNAYGNVSVSVGEGTPLTGKFEDIPWHSMRVMMQVEVSTDGSDNYTNMGSMQIQPVPYAFYAARAVVIQPAVASDEPIFQVKDNVGNLLFAVYETGVKVYVDDNDNAKAAKSKFAVTGRRASKTDEDLLTINADGTMVYVSDDNYTDGSKAAKSKFAVVGRSAKDNNCLMAIDGSGSIIYVDDNDNAKAAKSKFAVTGRRANKAEENNYSIDGDGSTVYVDLADKGAATNDVLSIDGASATFYIDNTEEGKAAKSKFAVTGRRAKDVQTAFVINGSGTLIYVDELDDSKAAKSKFAVTGRRASKNNDSFFTISQDSIRIYINDQPETTDSTGTVVTPSLSAGFAIVGMTQKNDLFVVNKDSTMIKTDTYVEEVQSISGEVEKIVDDSKAQRYYSTGNIGLRVEKKEGENTVASGEAFITYAYYQDENGEYLYLENEGYDNYREYRNYWIVDGFLYHDTTYFCNSNSGPLYVTEEDYTPSAFEGKDLLVILESKMKSDGYKALNFDGVNHYYKVEDEEEEEVMQAKRNVVTSIIDDNITIFSNNFTALKTLLAHISTLNRCDLNEDEITNMMLTDSDYGYILLDDEISVANIIEKEEYDQTASEEEIYARNPNLRCKHTLDEIQSMLYSLKHGFAVNASSTYGGSVNVSVVEGGYTDYGYYKYGTVLELTATVYADNYIFAGWSDGYKGNSRRVSVSGVANYEAVFKIQPFRYSTQTIDGVNTAIIHGFTDGYTDYETDLVIPEKITVGGVEYTVTVISTEAFVGKSLKSVELPPTIKTIGRDAFEGNRELWYVNIPDGVTSIGSGAFLVCGLGGVYIPESVTEIGSNAFSNCDIYCQREKKLDGWADDWAGSDCRVKWNQSVLPDYGYTITDYENHTVEFGPYYSSKSEVTIPATISIDGTDYTVTSIAPRLFKENHMVEKVVIEAGISEIPYEVFRFANNLKEISLPATVGSFGEQTFYGCKSLQTITLASGNPYWKIEGDALYSIDGKQLLVYFARTTKTDFEVPDGVEEISWYAFSYAQITNVSFPETLIKIGINAFSDCYNLTDTLTIPDNVTTIEWSAFSGCQYSGIHLPANLEALEAGVISEYITSVSIPANVKRIRGEAFWYCSQLTEINLPNSVTDIEEHAFVGIPLYSLVIPNSVTYIGKEFFWDYNPDNLPNLTFDTSSQWFYVIDGENTNTPIESSVYMTNGQIDVAKFFEFNKSYGMCKGSNGGGGQTGFIYDYDEANYTATITGYEGSETDLVIPSTTSYNGKEYTVTAIGESAFAENYDLLSVTFAEGSQVVTIGNNAFSDCYSLTSITIPATVTTIGESAFETDFNMRYVNIPDGVTQIGLKAFYECSSLPALLIPESVTVIGMRAFYYNLTLFCAAPSKPDGWAEDWQYSCNVSWGFSEIPLYGYADKDDQNKTLTITSYNGTETEVTIPATLKIGDDDYTVTAIGNSAFHGKSITKVSFAENCQITTIGESAFSGCSSMTSITLPESITTINRSAFSSCSSLTTLTIPKNVVNLEPDYTFTYCPSLQEIIVDEENTKFSSDGGVLYEGTTLWRYPSAKSGTKFTIPESITQIKYNAFERCLNLQEITLPSTITDVDHYAFDGSTTLAAINVNVSAGEFSTGGFYSSDGILYKNDDKVILYRYPQAKEGDSFTVQGTVSKIRQCAFAECQNLKSVYISDNIEMESVVFQSNTVIEHVTFPSDLIEIPGSTFQGCSSLKSIAIPATVKKIGSTAFQSCYSLRTIYFGGTEADKESVIIEGCCNEGLQNVELTWVYGTYPAP